MRTAVEDWLARWWAGEAGPAGRLLSVAAVPVELAFRGAVATRAAAYERGWRSVERAPVPVISVGNLTVGGTGKTPVTAWLARTLAGMGARPAIITRGDHRDEVELHRRWNPEVPVHEARRRIEGAIRAAGEGATVALLDDGFQHRALARDLDLVLVTAESSGPVRLLPRGPYRESEKAVARADLCLVVQRSSDTRDAARVAMRLTAETGTPVAHVRLRPGPWRSLSGGEGTQPRGPVLAVCGIARPGPFFQMVREMTGSEVEAVAFGDHHAYSLRDARELARRARGRTLVTTEKDAVKLVAFGDLLPDAVVLTLVVEVGEGRERLVDRLRAVSDGRSTVST